MKKTALINATLVDPSQKINKKGSLLIENKNIVKLIFNNNNFSEQDFNIINCKGLILCPGFVDIIMVLRMQKERMDGTFVPSEKEFFKFWGLDRKKLDKAKKNALVMHPGPINRGIEIDSDVADDISRSLILEQVKLGVAIRMAIIKELI